MLKSVNPPLAIVGMGCRFPGGLHDVKSFWNFLLQGRSAITEVPGTRWNLGRYYHPNPEIPGRMATKWGGFVDNLDLFDARFFGISPREAMRMDPQQRWLLEVAWEALEDAGIPPASLRGTPTGVFVGISSSDSASLQMNDRSTIDLHTNSGTTLSIASNRISYLFDFRGPSASVDTACSSSLVAISLACRSLWSGDAATALAGGVNALLLPESSIGFSKASMLSPSGRCFTFDARANGYVRAEGAGLIVIKPLDRARADGDRIYAVIRSAALNQDGHTATMTIPGQEAQEAMLEMACDQAGIKPCDVVYMETHGTGTPVGDPIEAAALGTVLCRGRAENEPCIIGSVKTNIGHLESAAGTAGIIKAALVLHHRTIPPNLNFKTPNPHIDFKALKLRVPTQVEPLPGRGGRPPIVAVNSFGFGGSNAHIVLEAAPEAARPSATPPEEAERPFLLPVSARDEEGLRRYARTFCAFLRNSPDDLADLCWFAGTRKEQHPHRAVFFGRDRAELRSRLLTFARKGHAGPGVVTGRYSGRTARPVFVFSGQGGQWWGMGQELLRKEPVFRRAVEEIDGRLRELAGWSLLDEMVRTEKESRIDRTFIAQPAIFALQVGLAELWRSWGVHPSSILGHSVGEVAAAWCAGVYGLEDAVRIIFHRSRLQETTAGRGKMAAVGLSEAEAVKAIGELDDRVQVAAINGPALVTLSGETAALQTVVGRLESAGTFVRWLRIDHAFHSRQMDPVREELLASLAAIAPRAAAVPWISTVTTEVEAPAGLGAAYWWRNVRQPVRMASAIEKLANRNESSYLELGPHPILVRSVQDTLAALGKKGAVFHSLRQGEEESLELLTNLARWHIQGGELDWARINRSARRWVMLPSYPWKRERFWIESAEMAERRMGAEAHPLLGMRLPGPQPAWQCTVEPERLDYLQDHRLWDRMVVPASAYAEIGLAVAGELFPGEPWAVEDLQTPKALFLSPQHPPTLRVLYEERDRSFRVCSTTGGGAAWETHASGRLQKLVLPDPGPADLAALRGGLPNHLDHQPYYDDYAAQGYQFGPVFQQVQNVWSKPGEALAEIVVPDSIRAASGAYSIHPSVLDACFHAVKGCRVRPPGPSVETFFQLPTAIRRFRLLAPGIPARLWSHARMLREEERYTLSDVLVYDDQGRRVAEALGFYTEYVERQDRADTAGKDFYRFLWEPAWLRGSRAGGPARLAAPDAIAKAVAREVPEVARRHDAEAFRREFTPRMEDIACRFVENAAVRLGWKPESGTAFGLADFICELGLAEDYQRLARAFLRALADGGVVRAVADDRWEILRPPRITDAEKDLDELAIRFPMWEPDVALQKAVGPRLADILEGATDPLDLLFPGGSSEQVDRYFKEGSDFPANYELVARAVARAVQDLPSRRVLRVLEVGAGAGALTRAVLPALPADRTEYTFTDARSGVVEAAQKQFADHPDIEFKTFDLEKPPGAQGLRPHRHELVLALNLHEAPDLRRALQTLRARLAPGGLLMLLNDAAPGHGLDNVSALLEGWRRYADTDLRTHSPIPSRRAWKELLEEAGFTQAVSISVAPNPDDAPQVVLVASVPSAPRADVDAEKPAAVENHLLFADRGGVAAAVATELRRRGRRVVLVRAGAAWETDGGDEYTVDPGSEEDLRRLLAGLDIPRMPLARVMHCWSLDHPEADGMDTEPLMNAQRTGVLHVLKIAQALAPMDFKSAPRVYLVTRGACHVTPGEGVRRLASAPLVGLARVAAAELEAFRWVRVDLDPAGAEDEVLDLCDELTLDSPEAEVAYRGGRRLASRLSRVSLEALSARVHDAKQPDGTLRPFRVQMDKPGVLTQLSLEENRRREPGPGEIEVAVRACGMNFRDVMKALGRYPGNPPDLKWFGDDFSGVVTRVGKDVQDVREGDSVLGMAPWSFRSYVIADRRQVCKKPDAINFEEAATLPTVFLTSHYALCHLARMRRGESILIHAAMGGVGQAALQIARGLGLEVFATAGTPEKRQQLREMGLSHVLNSRTVEFADEIMEITSGRGVDAVLNSLAGDFIPKSLSVLAPYGRFLEIGKVDIYEDRRIGLRALRNNVSCFVIDMSQLAQTRPNEAAALMRELAGKFERGEYRPLPRTVYPVADLVEAFRFMAQGRHTGKVVLSFEGGRIPIGLSREKGTLFRRDAAYLITGGAAGFGLEVARWMAGEGAGCLVLMSRSGPRDEAARSAIAQMRENGVRVLEARGDVTNPSDVHGAVEGLLAEHIPLKGVVHAANVLDDDFLAQLDERRFNTALHPKMLGAWNLHVATRDLPLDHFVCFSSISSVTGAVRQANYSAGNCFLDALAHYRTSQGLPALTVNWGALAGAGILVRNEKTAQYLQALGVKALEPAEVLEILGQALRRDVAQLVAACVDWASLARFSPAMARSPTFIRLVPRAGGSTDDSLRTRILTEPPPGRTRLVEDFLDEQIGAVLGGGATRIDRETPLTQIGLDSLMALELINRIEKEVKVSLPIGMMLNAPSIRAVASSLLGLLAGAAEGEAPAGGVEAAGALTPLAKSTLDPREFPLSRGQRRLWELLCREPESPAYRLAVFGRITPGLDVERNRQALQILYEHHPLLSATVARLGDRVVQRTHGAAAPEFYKHDVQGLSPEELRLFIGRRAVRPFNLEQGPLVRLELFQAGACSQYVMLDVHHLVSDLWSLGLIMNELMAIYAALSEGRSPSPEEPAYGYHDFVAWQQKHLDSPSGAKMLDYWKRQLEGFPTFLNLPPDHPREPFRPVRGDRLSFLLDEEFTRAIVALARRYSTTLFTTLLTAYQVLLHRLARQDDLVVGSAMAGRPYPAFHNVVGFFSNAVLLRSRAGEEATFEDCLRRAAQSVIGAIENQYCPLPYVVERLDLAKRVTDRASLLQASFLMERVPSVDHLASAVLMVGRTGYRRQVGGLTLESVDMDFRQAQTELTLSVEEAEGQVYGNWQYDRNLFDPATIERFHAAYVRLLTQACANPRRCIGDLVFN